MKASTFIGAFVIWAGHLLHPVEALVAPPESLVPPQTDFQRMIRCGAEAINVYQAAVNHCQELLVEGQIDPLGFVDCVTRARSRYEQNFQGCKDRFPRFFPKPRVTPAPNDSSQSN